MRRRSHRRPPSRRPRRRATDAPPAAPPAAASLPASPPPAEPAAGDRRRSERRAATACLRRICISTARLPGPSMRSWRFSKAPRAPPRRSTCSATCSKSGSATTTTTPTTRAPARASRALTASGVAVYALHGNRDFLLGEAFAQRTGVKLLPDPVMVDLYGVPHAAQSWRRVLHRGSLLPGTAQHRAPDPPGSGASCRCRSPSRRDLASAARAGSKAHTAADDPDDHGCESRRR